MFKLSVHVYLWLLTVLLYLLILCCCWMRLVNNSDTYIKLSFIIISHVIALLVFLLQLIDFSTCFHQNKLGSRTVTGFQFNCNCRNYQKKKIIWQVVVNIFTEFAAEFYFSRYLYVLILWQIMNIFQEVYNNCLNHRNINKISICNM